MSTLKSISERLGPSIFSRKMEKTWPLKKKIDGKVSISRLSRRFLLCGIINVVIFHIFQFPS